MPLVMARYFDTVSGSLERHGGTVENSSATPCLPSSAFPVHEDDALRAGASAIELRDGLGELNDEAERD